MDYWGEYIPVAQRRANALREMAKLRKRGRNIQPIEVDGRTIARSFWGKGWCDHLESFSDYENRLPRGRRYVRNGSVCHLDIKTGKIEAIVSGTELYNVTVTIKKLKPVIWKSVKAKCSGRIGSMLELLQGRLSDQVMTVVADRANGLFPKPSEISLRCDCPDWAIMCKHVAAVLYGVGCRLDHQPELLFLLRDVDAEELISTDLAVPSGIATGNAIDDDKLGDIFGIDLDDTDESLPVSRARASKIKQAAQSVEPTKATRKNRSAKRAKTKSAGQYPKVSKKTNVKAKSPKKRAENMPDIKTPIARAGENVPRIRPTGKSVARLRKRLGLSVPEFARKLNVSAASVYRWEAMPGRLKVQARTLAALAECQRL